MNSLQVIYRSCDITKLVVYISNYFYYYLLVFFNNISAGISGKMWTNDKNTFVLETFPAPTWSRLVLDFFPFCVTGRGSGGDGGSGGGLVVDVLIDGGDV